MPIRSWDWAAEGSVKWARQKLTNPTGASWACGPRDDNRRTRVPIFMGILSTSNTGNSIRFYKSFRRPNKGLYPALWNTNSSKPEVYDLEQRGSNLPNGVL